MIEILAWTPIVLFLLLEHRYRKRGYNYPIASALLMTGFLSVLFFVLLIEWMSRL